jgi:hypothetical protein
LWYGKADVRERYRANQLAQDANAGEASPGALLGRAVAKSGGAYRNVRRDLVDALAEDDAALEQVQDEELPDQLRKLSAPERVAHVQSMLAKRKQIQEQIAKLNRERQAYLTEQQKVAAAKAPEGAATLGDAVVEAIQTQLQASGFDVED